LNKEVLKWDLHLNNYLILKRQAFSIGKLNVKSLFFIITDILAVFNRKVYYEQN